MLRVYLVGATLIVLYINILPQSLCLISRVICWLVLVLLQ